MPGQLKSDRGDRSEAHEPKSCAAPSVLEAAESLHEQLLAAQRQRDEYRALLQSTQAEFENYQKRTQRESAEERRYALAPLARDLLPILDNLERALDAAKKEGERPSLIHGVALIHAQLYEVLARYGVIPIDALGQPFDPHLHEAVLARPASGEAPGTILDVLETGYRFHNRVLRPAKVVVAADQPA